MDVIILMDHMNMQVLLDLSAVAETEGISWLLLPASAEAPIKEASPNNTSSRSGRKASIYLFLPV